jgi:hypothetical protein
MRVQRLSKSGIVFLFLIFALSTRAEELISPVSGGNCPDTMFRMINYPEIDFAPYYADKSMHYGKEPLQVTGFWNRWFLRMIRVLGTILNQKAIPVIMYLVIFSMCAFILVRFLRGEADSVFQKNNENSIFFEEEGAQLTGSDLAVLLQEEISSGNYNKAVRILFLQTLQHLANHGLISLHPEKTNSDFLYEIPDVRIRDQFRDLTRIYEFLWYGNQALDHSWFNRIASKFRLFNDQING